MHSVRESVRRRMCGGGARGAKALAAFAERVNQPGESIAVQPQPMAARSGDFREEVADPLRGPRDIPLGLRYFILKRDSFRCVVCGRSPATQHGVVLHVDHIAPWAKGGATVAANLRTLCSECNLGKGDRH